MVQVKPQIAKLEFKNVQNFSLNDRVMLYHFPSRSSRSFLCKCEMLQFPLSESFRGKQLVSLILVLF